MFIFEVSRIQINIHNFNCVIKNILEDLINIILCNEAKEHLHRTKYLHCNITILINKIE